MKVTKFLEYSKQVGTLTPADPRAEAEIRLVKDLKVSREVARKLVDNGINCLAACEGVEVSDLASMGFTTEETLTIIDGMRKAGV